MVSLLDAIGSAKPALLVGNGINQFNMASSSWDALLAKLSAQRNVSFSDDERREMSNTELFDILDLADRPTAETAPDENLQRLFCESMKDWAPAQHHIDIVEWARRHNSPIITVNFDENLSKAIGAKFWRDKDKFTDFYPWSSYFSEKEITDPKSSFAIWHAHGMMRYPRSIRLGLTHYMGAVQRARSNIIGKGGLIASETGGIQGWGGEKTWLAVLFYCPLLIFGFGFKQDENFLRWLFLERARFHRRFPTRKVKTWYVTRNASPSAIHRKAFFSKLGMEFVTVDNHADIYEADFWKK